jgi:nucleoid DNA-binding protein
MFNEVSINKRTLWRFVNIKINRIIHHYHVFSVITILFDEILKDLKAGKDVKIFNFGLLQLKNTKPRKYHDVRFNKVLLSEGHRILKFTLAQPIRKKLCVNLDKKIKDE